MADTPVVLINGPRQSGKTTLAKQYDPQMAYFTLDDDNVLNAARQDPMSFIERIKRGIIDEVQRAPELLRNHGLPALASLFVAGSDCLLT